MGEISVEPDAQDTWADRMLREFVDELMGPRDGECLLCYVARMLEDFGCDTRLRFALRYRDLTAPAAVALPRRLGQVGAFCDCEIFLNGWWLDRRWWLASGRPVGVATRTGETSTPAALPPCAGVRRGSTQPCSTWVRRRRGAW